MRNVLIGRLVCAMVVAASALTLGASPAMARAPHRTVTRATSWARAADGPSYTVPPTNTGALGISKNSWGKASDVANGIAAVSAGVAAYSAAVAAGLSVPTLGMSVPTAGAVALGAGLVSAGAWLAGSVFSYLSRDPADRHFRTIFKPRFAHVPSISLAPQFANVGITLHALVRSQVRLVGYATAFVTSVNRATGARHAHAKTWVRRQKLAAARYARAAARILFGFERQRDAIAAAYRADGVELNVPASAVAQSQSQVKSGGLPSALTKGLKALTKGTVAKPLKKRILNFGALKRSIASQPPQAFNFNAFLSAPALALQEDKVAGALIGYAQSVTKHK
jgi:hypothetical protein